MYVDRLVESREGRKGRKGREGVRGERICLVTRPHWFLIVRQGAGSLVLIVCGLLLLLFAWQPGRLLVALAPGLLDPQGSPGPAGPTGPTRTVPSISGV